ncbi:MAG TPA: hypothetical protein P5205_08430 [Candidatus Paceibacterota bacterium]|nr:hypothetical protein [Verrucomicrobiota bacterium]HSA10384.1 hypothetical protein [Candidatus Paceibacterota bacterium]
MHFHIRSVFLAFLLALPPYSTTLAAKSVGGLTGPWQLFVDDYLVASKDNIVRRYHAFQKYTNNPVLAVDQPWEHNVVSCSTVLPAEDGKGFRMWYHCWTHPNDPDRGHALYAVSSDGIHWQKPNLGLLPWKVNGSSNNNFVGASGSIMHTPNDPDPARRYKAVHSGNFFFRASPDGLRWERLTQGELFKAGDTGHLMWDPLTDKYRAYAKINALVAGQRRRAIGYSEGTGFEAWPSMRLIMAPDDFDDRWVKPGSVQRTHFYNCPVFACQSHYLGLMSIYRAEDDEGYFHGPIFVELVTSRNGIHWLREDGDRPPLLPCGPPRTWDHGMVFGASIVPVGDQLYLYYSGYDGLHDYLPFHSAIGLAFLRKDGFASLDGEDIPGEVTTKRLTGLTGQLHLNCEAAAGLLQVEVLDDSGSVVPGYSKHDCNEPRGDGIDQVVAWRNHAELPATSGPLRLRFFLKNVSLYSFYAGDNVKVLDDPYRESLAALFTFEGDGGRRAANKLPPNAARSLRFRGTSKIDGDAKNAAFGSQSVTIPSLWRPLNSLQITDSANLGTRFTLAVMARSTDNRLGRLFSSYDGNGPVNTSELIFECDPSGKAIPGLRLFCRGIPVTSQPLTFADGKYHHLAVTWDDGHVRFYLDGADAGEAWLPGGAPVVMPRDLLVGDDAELGRTDEQFNGNMDDILVLGRALSPEDLKSLAAQGAEAFFKPRK